LSVVVCSLWRVTRLKINEPSTHFKYLRRDDQAEFSELAWVAWLNTEMVYLRMITQLSTNPARRRVTEDTHTVLNSCRKRSV